MYLFYLNEDELKTASEKDHFTKYKVNLFIDNSCSESTNKAPVILELNPNHHNLFGKLEYESHNGTLKTDFTKIVPGAFHKANGGFLILYIDQLLRNAYSWDILKRSLQLKMVKLDSLSAIKPEPIPIDIKIILIGNQYLYNVLFRYDEEFNKYFKVFVDFDNVMLRNKENENGVASFIAAFCNKNNLRHFTSEAVDVVFKI